MHNPESFLENETQNSLGFREINSSPNPCQKSRPSNDKQKKKKKKRDNLPNSRFCRLVGQQSKNQRKRKKRQVLEPYQRTEQTMKMRVTVIPIIIGTLVTVSKDLVGELEELEIGGLAETS